MDTLRFEQKNSVGTVVLNRPDRRNALDEALLRELTGTFSKIPPGIRVIVLAAEGSVFCAGADLQWMKRAPVDAENRREAEALAVLLKTLDECPVPVVARVQGSAFGGGCGLVSVCDVAIAAETAQFGFTEVRLGLAPSVISTFVLSRIGTPVARRYFLSGERFGATEARAVGLIHEVVPADRLDARVQEMVQEFLECGPAAVAAAKKLIREIDRLPRDQAIDHALRVLAALRASPEAQEGIRAFLEKRKPRWP